MTDFTDSPPTAWACDRCLIAGSHLSLRVMRKFTPKPSGADAVCSTCGAPLPDVTRLLLLVEALTSRAKPRSSEPRPEAAPIEPGGLYSLREVARFLRLDRTGTLRGAIDAGHLASIHVCGAERVSGAELLRVHRQGLPKLASGRTPPATRRTAKRRRAPKNARAAGAITTIPL